jgi:WD40 repeat protein
MIKRREFIAACIACGLGGTAAWGGSRSDGLQELDWACEAIQTPSASLKRRAPVVTGVCLAPDESLVAVVGDDHLVSIYDLVSKKFRGALQAHRDWVRAASFAPDRSTLATAGNDRMLFCWNPANWEQPLLLAQQPNAIFGLAFSPNGESLATVGFSSTLFIYDMVNRQERRRLECPCEDMRAIAYSRDGELVAAGGRCGSVRVWESATGKQVAEYKVHQQRIRSLQFNSRRQILSCGDDQVVALTDPFQSALSQQLPRQAARLFAVTLLDDQICATSGSDNRIAIWNLETRELVGSLKGHTGTVSCLSSGARLLVSGSYDTQIRIWQRAAKVSQLLEPGAKGEEPGWSPRVR